MEIITEGGRLDIPADYTCDFEFINPMLSEVGSQTAPGTLPYTPRNLKLLDYPQRYDRANKYTIKRNVILREGTFQKRATQAVLKANEKDKIVTTFYLDEAIFYEKIKDVQMSAVNYGEPRKQTVRELFNLCSDVMFNREVDDFHLFPVVADFDGKTVTSGIWLNKIKIDPDTKAVELWDQSTEQIEIDGTKVDVPFGFGVTPFLKVAFIVRKIIEHFGYSVGDSVFESDISFKQLVLVNNVADAIVGGVLDYTQLLPTCNVSDFILALQKKFGLVFLCDDASKTISTFLIDDMVSSDPDMDLTPFAAEAPRVEWHDNEQLKISAGTAIRSAAPPCELLSDLVAKYGEIVFLKNDYGIQTNGKLYYVAPENTIYRQYYPEGGIAKRLQRFSPYFNHYTSKTKEMVEYASDDEQLPMFRLRIKSTTSAGDNVYNFYYTPTIPEVVFLNSTLQKGDDNVDNSKTTEDIKMMFCFKVPDLQKEKNSGVSISMGTTTMYDYSGETWGNWNLKIAGEDGLYERFWKKWDMVIQNSNQTVNCILNLTLTQLQMLNMCTPKLLFNQPVFIERIKCKIGNNKFEITEAVFRTLREYED
jgi:hypothetical protein